MIILRSSNGRTAASDAAYIGSNPVRRSKTFYSAVQSIYNTQVNVAPSSKGKTLVFGTSYRGSNPRGASKLNAALAHLVEQRFSKP